MVALTGFGFTACGDDNDEPDLPKQEDHFTTEYRFEVTFTDDLIKTADVKAYILSPEGTLSEETITQTNVSWTLKGNSIPDKAGVMIEFDTKQGVEEGTYKLGYSEKTTVKCLNNGTVVSVKSNDHSTSMTVPSQYLDRYYGTSLTLGGEISSSGEANVTDGSNLDFGLNGGISRPPFGAIRE